MTDRAKRIEEILRDNIVLRKMGPDSFQEGFEQAAQAALDALDAMATEAPSPLAERLIAWSQNDANPDYFFGTDSEVFLAMQADCFEAAKALGAGRERVRHRKGGVYEVLTRDARVQTDTPLTDYDRVVVYEGSGRTWVRPIAEMDDGRFEAVADA